MHRKVKLSVPWRKLRGFNYLAKVIEGVSFKDGIKINESNQVAA